MNRKEDFVVKNIGNLGTTKVWKSILMLHFSTSIHNFSDDGDVLADFTSLAFRFPLKYAAYLYDLRKIKKLFEVVSMFH